ncbi:hypothetical protein ACN9JG_06275 [Cereibacter azotoformans]|uniref:hypothetical protein n=1 Tax=Cereibacter azotoformans TaxID=43057 RepID=UPI003B2150E8
MAEITGPFPLPGYVIDLAAIAAAEGHAQAAGEAATSAAIAKEETEGLVVLAQKAVEDAAVAAGNSPFPTYAEALEAPKPAPLTKIEAVVSGRLVCWTRQAGGPCLGGGWVPAGDATPEHFGAPGDGVADDTGAFQAAVDIGRRIIGRPGAVYRINGTVIIPDDRDIDLNGARLMRGGLAPWMVETSKARTTWDNTNITLRNWWCEDDATEATRGAFNLLVCDNLRVMGYKVLTRSPYTGSKSAWSCYISGKNILIDDIDVDSTAAGLWSDGLHFGYVENLVIGKHTIRAGDDAIAFHHVPANYPWVGRNLPSKNIVVQPGFVSSEEAHGIRVGAYSSAASAGGVAGQASNTWQNIKVVNEVFGRCKTAVTLIDNRPPGEITGQNDLVAIKGQCLHVDNALRVLYVQGNPDVAVAANRGQKNFGRVQIDLTASNGNLSTGSLVYAGGVDELVMTGDLTFYNAGGDAAQTHLLFYQIRRLVLDRLTTKGDTTGNIASYTYCDRIEVVDCEHLPDGLSEFRTHTIVLNADQPVSVLFRGGAIRETARAIGFSGAGRVMDFVVDDTLIQSSGSFPTSGTFSSVTWEAGGKVVCNPAGGLSCAVGDLPGASVPVAEGHRAYATNGRKSGEGVGAGSGQPVYRNGSVWRVLRDDSVVAF